MYTVDDLKEAEILVSILFPELAKKPILRKAMASCLTYAKAFEDVDDELDEVAELIADLQDDSAELATAMGMDVGNVKASMAKLEARIAALEIRSLLN